MKKPFPSPNCFLPKTSTPTPQSFISISSTKPRRQHLCQKFGKGLLSQNHFPKFKADHNHRCGYHKYKIKPQLVIAKPQPDMRTQVCSADSADNHSRQQYPLNI